jgi:palmitoyltransferase ZDHHC9/14/18
MTGMIIVYIITILTYIICIWAWIDCITTSPGYLTTNTITEEDFKSQTPTITIKGQKIPLKYCETCKTVRDIRSMHCSICGFCIKKHDHHCGFVANCIGERNIKKFVYFLASIVIHSLAICIPCIVIYSKMTDILKSDIGYAISLAILCMSAIFFLGMGAFLLFHLYLISTNRTTNEHIRNQYDKNLFNDGCSDNFKEVFYV